MKPSIIVVGVDGSVESAGAMRWGAAEAAWRGIELLIVHAYDPRAFAAAVIAGSDTFARSQATVLVETAASEAQSIAPGVTVNSTVAVGPPAPVLLDAAGADGLIAVGNAGLGPVAGLLCGSVGPSLVGRARGPVLVWRGRPGPVTGPVVVGVDGSATAQSALAAACELANARGATVSAIRCVPASTSPTDDAVALHRQRLLDEVAPWQARFPELVVETSVVEARAAEGLLAASATASLVVVANTVHAAAVGSILGSVGLQLLREAKAPVLLVR